MRKLSSIYEAHELQLKTLNNELKIANFGLKIHKLQKDNENLQKRYNRKLVENYKYDSESNSGEHDSDNSEVID